MSSPKTCKDCSYHSTTAKSETVCKRYPPTPHYRVTLNGEIDLQTSVFPLVTDLCGEFVERPVAPPEGDLGVKMTATAVAELGRSLARARIKKGE